MQVVIQLSWLFVQYHPDVNKQPGAEDKFKEISNAYEVGFELLFVCQIKH